MQYNEKQINETDSIKVINNYSPKKRLGHVWEITSIENDESYSTNLVDDKNNTNSFE